MRDNPLRQLLGSIEAGDGSWTALIGRSEDIGALDGRDRDSIKGDVRAYLDDTATLLDALGVAVESGRVDWVEVLEAAHGYLGNRDDLVSDDEGVLGILDDAFLCRSLLRHAAAASADPAVVVTDLGSEGVVRDLLGGPVAATLDVAAAQTVGDIRREDV